MTRSIEYESSTQFKTQKVTRKHERNIKNPQKTIIVVL